MAVDPPGGAGSGARLDVSRRGYVLLLLLLLAAYLGTWLGAFPDVYGWLADDVTVYRRAEACLRSWRSLFDPPNALHALTVLAHLPLRLGLGLASEPIPFEYFREGRTPSFRALLLCAVLWHAGVLVAWSEFARRLAANRLTALLSSLLLAASPAFALWAPQPDSRFIGLPFALPGLALLLFREPTRASNLAAGLLLWLSQSLHYDVLPLLVPFCLLFWAHRLRHEHRVPALWGQLLGFATGILAPQLALELVSRHVIGHAWRDGPLGSLVHLRDLHRMDGWSPGVLAYWAAAFRTQMGVLLPPAVLAGAVLLGRGGGDPRLTRARRLVLASTAAALLLVILSPTAPFYRHTVALQPILLLAAAAALAAGAARLGRTRGAALGLLAAGVVAAGASPLVEARAVLRGHGGLGKALRWIADRGLAPRTRLLELDWPGALRELPAEEDAYLLTCFPWRVLREPDLRPGLAVLRSAAPRRAWPFVWSTRSVQLEEVYWWTADIELPEVSQVALYAAADIRRQLELPRLEVRAAMADSSATAGTGPWNVLDDNTGWRGDTLWRAAPGAGEKEHWVELGFVGEPWIDSVQILWPRRSAALRYRIEVTGPEGRRRPVWQWSGARPSPPLVEAVFERMPARALRVVIGAQVEIAARDGTWRRPASAGIDELRFPGYLARPLPGPRERPLLRWRSTGDRVGLYGAGDATGSSPSGPVRGVTWRDVAGAQPTDGTPGGQGAWEGETPDLGAFPGMRIDPGYPPRGEDGLIFPGPIREACWLLPAAAGAGADTGRGILRCGSWYGDRNGNGRFDGAGAEPASWLGGPPEALVAGDWQGDRITRIGVYRGDQWYLDWDGDGVFEPYDDRMLRFGNPGDVPLAGDWAGDGRTRIGTFRAGEWFLDADGDGRWEGPPRDRHALFGQAGDVPVLGPRLASGRRCLGVLRGRTLFLDADGDDRYDATADRQVELGPDESLVPVVGWWRPAPLGSQAAPP